MEKLFKAFYYPNDDEMKQIWNNDKTLFVLDTNILINLYRYKEETRADFFKLLEKIKDRVFLPHHVVLEYQRNRLSAIASHRSNINHFKNAMSSSIDFREILFGEDKYKQAYSDIKQKYPDIGNELERNLQEITNIVKEKLDVVINKIEEKKQEFPHVNTDDSIRKTLSDMLLKIGKPFSQDKLDQVYKDGELRYKYGRAPGFKDKGKDTIFYYDNLKFEQKYGDLIIWEQIKLHVEERGDIINLIFISDDDSKNDWFESIDSEGKKIIGARSDLQSEIYQTFQSINYFVMHNSSGFFRLGNGIYNLNVQEQSIVDIEDSHNIRIKKNIYNHLLRKNKLTISDKFYDYILSNQNKDINSDNSLFYEKIDNLSEIEEKIRIKTHEIDLINRQIESIRRKYKYEQEDPLFDYDLNEHKELNRIINEEDMERLERLRVVEKRISDTLDYLKYQKERVKSYDIPF